MKAAVGFWFSMDEASNDRLCRMPLRFLISLANAAAFAFAPFASRTYLLTTRKTSLARDTMPAMLAVVERGSAISGVSVVEAVIMNNENRRNLRFGESK